MTIEGLAMLESGTTLVRRLPFAERGQVLLESAAARLTQPLGSWLTELSDQADSVWEPFLVDDPPMAAES